MAENEGTQKNTVLGRCVVFNLPAMKNLKWVLSYRSDRLILPVNMSITTMDLWLKMMLDQNRELKILQLKPGPCLYNCVPSMCVFFAKIPDELALNLDIFNRRSHLATAALAMAPPCPANGWCPGGLVQESKSDLVFWESAKQNQESLKHHLHETISNICLIYITY